jgi:hypothetical protein
MSNAPAFAGHKNMFLKPEYFDYTTVTENTYKGILPPSTNY